MGTLQDQLADKVFKLKGGKQVKVREEDISAARKRARREAWKEVEKLEARRDALFTEIRKQQDLIKYTTVELETGDHPEERRKALREQLSDLRSRRKILLSEKASLVDEILEARDKANMT